MSVSYLFPLDALPFVDVEIGKCFERTASERKKPRRNTKVVGDLSELIVAAALTRAGYYVSKPLGDSHRYDLVIDDGNELHRVQVKTGRLLEGSIRVHCSSSHAHRGRTTRSYRGQIEFLGVFCPQTGGVYLLPESDLTDSAIHLRVAPTVNRQDRRIRWASRYKLV